MAWPVLFNSLTNPQPLQDFDSNFNAVTAATTNPCVASGTNSISLTPVTNVGALQAYQELCGARFRAVGNSNGPVAAQINGLGFLPVYKADGLTQANIGDIIAGQQYVLHYSAGLQGGLGGFFLESPTVQPIGSGWFSPGGRLTFTAGVPVNTATVAGPSTLYYSPYAHPFVPIYNGATLQMYQFTSSLTDINGLSFSFATPAIWPASTTYDIFVTAVGSAPVLVTGPAWTNSTTRALALANFGGFPTNAGSATFQRSAGSGSLVIPANQATFLGSMSIGGVAGQSLWQFGGAASGGIQAALWLCNYYNKVLFNTVVADTGAGYTYSGGVRMARGSNTNAIYFIQSDSERAASFQYGARTNTAAVSGTFCAVGLGFNSNTGMNEMRLSTTVSAVVVTAHATVPGAFAGTGQQICYALEQADGTNLGSFDQNSLNTLAGQIWL